MQVCLSVDRKNRFACSLCDAKEKRQGERVMTGKKTRFELSARIYQHSGEQKQAENIETNIPIVAYQVSMSG
jgi:hypothetical protein